MNAEDRFLFRVAQVAHEEFTREGYLFLTVSRIEELAQEEQVPDQLARHVLARLDDQYLLRTHNGHLFKGDVGLPLVYEQEYDREAFWEHNGFRREVLKKAAELYGEDEDELIFRQDGDRFTDRPYGEAMAAARVLEHLDLVTVHETMGRNFRVRATPEGFDVSRDETRLDTFLPTSATMDEDAHLRIASDAAGVVIRSCEQLLRERQWEGALRELARGDEQYGKSDWVDAVSEYYSALESALKHRLDELGVKYANGATLRRLAKAAAEAGAIPMNYQAAFAFVDSIRSPRRHGSGSRGDAVEVGPAEALLMGNLVRSLILYLGHRPR